MTKHAVILVGDNQNSRTAGERGHEQEEEIGESRARLARMCYATSVYRNASTRDEQGTIRGAFRSRTARPTLRLRVGDAQTKVAVSASSWAIMARIDARLAQYGATILRRITDPIPRIVNFLATTKLACPSPQFHR